MKSGYKIETIDKIIPKNFEEKQKIAKFLEYKIIDFMNKTKLEPIEAILTFFEMKNIRIEDVDDYIPYMSTLIKLAKNIKNNKKQSRSIF